MGSLFEKAKKKAEGTTTKSGKQKAEVVLSNDADFAAIKRLQELNEQIASLEAEKAIVYGDVRQLGVDQFVKKYTEENRFTDSFKIVVRNSENNDTAVFQLAPTDKYIKIDEHKAELLKKKYGETVIAEQTTYSLDNDMVDKHGETLSKLIEQCKDIPEQDKEKMIKAETKLAVKKGSIKEFRSNNEMRNHEIQELVNDLQPVFQIKTPKVEVAEK